MKVILYASDKSNVESRIHREVEYLISENDMMIHSTMDSLVGHLRQPAGDSDTVYIISTQADDLSFLVANAQLILGKRLILILPDETELTIASGHKLQPRFITQIDSDFSEVGAVLRKMLIKSRKDFTQPATAI